MQPSRRIPEWLDLLDDPRVFRTRIFVIAWAPVWVAAILAETPNPRLGHGPWALAVTAATVVAWPLFLLLGRLIGAVSRRHVRWALTPMAFGLVGLARGATLGYLAERFSLLDDTHWGVRLVGGVLAGVVLISAVSVVERLSIQLIELQRDARRLRLEREAGAQPVDESRLHAFWVRVVREAIDSHFDEEPWTPDARAALERRGSTALAEQIAHRLAESRRPVAPPSVSLRIRLSENAHLRRLVELATARVGGARTSLTVTTGLAVVALHGGSITDVTQATATVVVVAVATLVAWGLATVFERGHRRFLRRASMGARFTLITLSLLVLGFAVGLSAGAVDQLALGAPRPAVAMLLVGMLPAVVVLVGWASLVIEGVSSYSALLRVENRQAESLLARHRLERERFMRQASRSFDRRIEADWLPLVRVIEREAAVWRSAATRARVQQSTAMLEHTHRSVPQALDALPLDWAGFALVDCVVDDDLMARLADLPAREARTLLDGVRARITEAVVEFGAQAVEITIRQQGEEMVVVAAHDGVPGVGR